MTELGGHKHRLHSVNNQTRSKKHAGFDYKQIKYKPRINHSETKNLLQSKEKMCGFFLLMDLSAWFFSPPRNSDWRKLIHLITESKHRLSIVFFINSRQLKLINNLVCYFADHINMQKIV